MYTFEFPDGCRLKARALTWKTVATLKEQCEPRGILKLISTKGDCDEYFLYESRLQSLMASPPFVNDKHQGPTPGVYKVVLQDMDLEEDVKMLSLCSIGIQWLNHADPYQVATECCGDYLQHYNVTCPQADAKYSIAIIANTIIVTLDFAQHTERILGIDPPVNILSASGGAITGSVGMLAQALPFAILYDMVIALPVSSVIITGEGLSGSVAHAAAILFRDALHSISTPPTVQAVSFCGPLCGSPSLAAHLADTGQSGNHITVNTDGMMLDRLWMDYQCMSALADSEVKTWVCVYSCVRDCLQSYLRMSSGEGETIDMSSLIEAEEHLTYRLSLLLPERVLLPIGRYLLYRWDGHLQDSPGDVRTLDMLRTLHAAPTRKHVNHVPNLPFNKETLLSLPDPSFLLPAYAFTPHITGLCVTHTPSHTALHIEGRYMDSVQRRLPHTHSHITFATAWPPLPFKISSLDMTLLASVRLISVTCYPHKVVILVSGLPYHEHGQHTLAVCTDFGDTNSLSFCDESTVQDEECTPSLWLHSSMNADLFKCAFLRVAICCKQCGARGRLAEHHAGMAQLLDLLLSLEGDICGFSDNLLVNGLDQFVEGSVDVGLLQAMCQSRFEQLSRFATEYVQMKGAELTFQGIRRVTGNIMAQTWKRGGISILDILHKTPLLVLTVPALSVVRHVMQAEVSVMTSPQSQSDGLLDLPAMLQAVFDTVMPLAEENAQRDHPSYRYKQVLSSMITCLGGSPLEVNDALPLMEEDVISRVKTLFPRIDLSRCTMEQLLSALNASQNMPTSTSSNTPLASESRMPVGIRLTRDPSVLTKLRLIGRLYGMRQFFRSHIMIGFVGVHNAGKSTTVANLFEEQTYADIVDRTEDIHAYRLGEWVDRAAQKHANLRQWMREKGKHNHQVYAVDFPGITDDRDNIGFLTKKAAALVSVFVVVVKAGHVAAPEKKAVLIAKEHHKPFIVVVNHADTIAHELRKPGHAECIRQHYAATLGVPSSIIHFMNALDPNCNDKLRGILFGLLQPLIGPDIVNALALRMVPPAVGDRIDTEWLDRPDVLATATHSLLFNLCSLRSTTLNAICTLVAHSHIPQAAVAATGVVNSGMSFPVRDVIRRTAVSLGVAPSSYETLTKVMYLRSIPFKTAVDEAECSYLRLTSGEIPRHIEQVVATLTLTALREQIHSYFGHTVCSGTSSFSELVVEVLIGLLVVCSQWVDEGFAQSSVEAICVDLFGSTLAVTPSLFVHRLSAVEMSCAGEPVDANTDECDVDDYDWTELQYYREAREMTLQLHSLTFTPCPWLAGSGCSLGADWDAELEQFHHDVCAYVSDNYEAKKTIVLPSMDNVLSPLLEAVLYLSDEICCHQLVLTIRGGDGRNMTQEILERAARELNEAPGKVCIGLRVGVRYDVMWCYVMWKYHTMKCDMMIDEYCFVLTLPFCIDRCTSQETAQAPCCTSLYPNMTLTLNPAP